MIFLGAGSCSQPFRFESARNQTLVLELQLPLFPSLTAAGSTGEEGQKARFLVPSVSTVELRLSGEGHDFERTVSTEFVIDDGAASTRIRIDNIPSDRAYNLEAVISAGNTAIYSAAAPGVHVSAQKAAEISLFLEPHHTALDAAVSLQDTLAGRSLNIPAEGFRFIPLDFDTAGSYELVLSLDAGTGIHGVLFVPESKFLDGQRPGLSDGITVDSGDLSGGTYRIIICFYNPGASSIEFDWSLVADWQVNTYNIIFNADGGEGTMEPQEVNYNQTLSLPPNIFTRTGYSFIGWAVESGGEVAYADEDTYTHTIDDDMTLYALWQELEIIGVTIDLSNPDDISIGNGEDIVLDQSGEQGEQTLTVNATAGFLNYYWSLNGNDSHPALEINAGTPHVVTVDSLMLEVGGVYELLLEVEIAEDDWRSAILYFEVVSAPVLAYESPHIGRLVYVPAGSRSGYRRNQNV
ncbi:hypothetical protein JCM12856_26630 [Spirochaeta dissipatitropha]